MECGVAIVGGGKVAHCPYSCTNYLTRLTCKHESYTVAMGSLVPCKILASRGKCEEVSLLKSTLV